jgi:hypothetical protein
VCVSFTILSLSLVIDTARSNGIIWDAVIPCEMLRVCPKITESTFERVKYGFTTEQSYHMLWW